MALKDLLQKIDWKHAITEVVLIVLGIIIAFGIDTWWDGVKEHKEMIETLEGIEAEFELNRVQLLEKMDDHRRVVRASRELLGVTGPEAADVSEERIGQLISDLCQSHTFNPQKGALNALLNSGKLQIVKKKRLQVLLAAWPGMLDDVSEEESRGVWQVWEVLTPWLNKRIQWANIPPRISSGTPLPRSKHDVEIDDLLRDREFENMIENRLTVSLHILEDQEPVLKTMEEILGLIRVERKK